MSLLTSALLHSSFCAESQDALASPPPTNPPHHHHHLRAGSTPPPPLRLLLTPTLLIPPLHSPKRAASPFASPAGSGGRTAPSSHAAPPAPPPPPFPGAGAGAGAGTRAAARPAERTQLHRGTPLAGSAASRVARGFPCRSPHPDSPFHLPPCERVQPPTPGRGRAAPWNWATLRTPRGDTRRPRLGSPPRRAAPCPTCGGRGGRSDGDSGDSARFPPGCRHPPARRGRVSRGRGSAGPGSRPLRSDRQRPSRRPGRTALCPLRRRCSPPPGGSRCAAAGGEAAPPHRRCPLPAPGHRPAETERMLPGYLHFWRAWVSPRGPESRPAAQPEPVPACSIVLGVSFIFLILLPPPSSTSDPDSAEGMQ